MKPLIIYFFFMFLAFNSCSASYEGQERTDPHPTYKRLRVEQAEIKTSSSLLLNQWNFIPYEVFVTVFDNLSFKELARAQLVCKYWSIVAKNKTLSVDNQYLKRSYSTLLRKIDNNPKIQEHVKEKISNYVLKRNLRWQFDTIPDFLHKTLLAPSAIAKVLRTPELMVPLFESNIKASCIYNALQQQTLNKQQQLAIEFYSKLRPVGTWHKTIFSEDFLNYIRLYRPYYKAYYLLFLFQLPTGSPIHTFLNMIERNLESSQTYTAGDEEQALWFPKAMLDLEIPSIDSYRISYFCYKWARNSSSSTFQRLWQRYEKLFLRNAALGNIPGAQFRLGVIAYHKGNYQNAERFYRQAASQAHTKAKYELGALLLEQGRQQEAELFLNQAAMIGHLFAHFALAQLWFQQGKLEEVKSSFRQVAEKASSNMLYELAQLIKGDCHRQELELFYRQIVSYAPFDQQHVLSTLLLSKNDLRQIDPFYRQVLNYGSTNVQYILADLLIKNGRVTLAKILLQEIEDQKGLGNLP